MNESCYAARMFKYGLLALVVGLAGCATQQYADPQDPLEPMNRAVYSFNNKLDKAVLTPLAEGYQAVVPKPVNRGVTNFFSNLGDVTSSVNNLLQLKVGRALNDAGRVVVNSTVGIGGVFDVASNMDLPRYDEDFGETLGVWGVPPGPYLVLPVLGPSTVRDSIGTVVDWYTDPVTYLKSVPVRWSLRGLDLVDTRADLLNASRVLEEAALDPYAFVRDAYLQKRANAVHDGNPPDPDTQ